MQAVLKKLLNQTSQDAVAGESFKGKLNEFLEGNTDKYKAKFDVGITEIGALC